MLTPLSNLLERVAAWLLVAVALVFGLDVALRYGLGVTRAWLPDLEWYTVCVAVALSFAPALAAGAHVAVELFAERLPPRVRQLVMQIGHVTLLLPWCAFVVYAGARYALNSWAIGEGSPDPGGLPWRWLPKVAVVLGFGLLGVEGLRQVVHPPRESGDTQAAA